MKRSIDFEEGQMCRVCDKRAALEKEDPIRQSEALSLTEIQTTIETIQTWANIFRDWMGLETPLPESSKSETAKWLDDHKSTGFRPPHNPKFGLFVRKVLTATYRQTPTDTSTRIVDKYLDLMDQNWPIAPWESPIELLLCTLLFNDGFQADFLDLALDLVSHKQTPTNVNQLLGTCCWAIVARQHEDHRQEELTRSAVSNLIALILKLKGGPLFAYSATLSEFSFIPRPLHLQEKLQILKVWMPHFALFWFNVDLPNFDTRKDTTAAFVEHFHDLALS